MTVTLNTLNAPRMVDRVRHGLKFANEIDISVSFVRYSGVQLIVDDLRKFLERGGKARLLTSTYMGITQPEALRSLSKLSGLQCRVQQSATGFHPKMYLFLNGKSEVWVGSSNLSKGGLASNIEANLMSDVPATVAEVRRGFEDLWSRPDVYDLSSTWLDSYAQAFLNRIAQSFVVPPPFVVDDLGRFHTDSSGGTLATKSAQPDPNEAQLEALSALAELRRQGATRAVVVAAPGVGKTFLAAFDAVATNPKRVLFVSHRLEHLSQAKNTFQRVFPGTKTFGLVGAGESDLDADLVFCSIQSLANRFEDMQSHGRFDYVVIDEFHHAAAPSYRSAIDELRPDFLLGLTATPERQDGHDILQLCDFNIAYEVRLIEAVNRAWLLPFHYFGIGDDTVDWSKISWRGRGFDLSQLEVALAVEERVDLILRHANDKGFDGHRRATVGFCAGVKHARFMCESFGRRGLEAAVLTGDDNLTARQEIYARFADPTDPLEWLFVADLLNEGVDIPTINSLLFLRPTDSATIFIQQLGRGLRLVEGSEVLTVLDFVGHHRNAWLTLDAISDRSVSPNTKTVAGITPPTNCEIILDDLTLEILTKVKRFVGRKKDTCSDAYDQLREDNGPPFPIDLWGRSDMPGFGDFRSAFGTWLNLRREKGDAEPWELSLDDGDPLAQFLATCEKDWQQSRVYAYALIWALVDMPGDANEGYERFFQRFPKWRAEYKPLAESKVWNTIEKQFGDLITDQGLTTEVLSKASKDELLKHVEGRIHLTLEKDFKNRHGGILRTPADLRVHSRYARNEIMNHFGVQYDPAKHNLGVIGFPGHIVIITKLDTSGAKTEFHYKNELIATDRMRWQSQNKQRQDNNSGKGLINHEENGTVVHLFVQRKSSSEAVYLGPVIIASVSGNAPMTLEWQLQNQVSEQVAEDLGVSFQ